MCVLNFAFLGYLTDYLQLFGFGHVLKISARDVRARNRFLLLTNTMSRPLSCISVVLTHPCLPDIHDFLRKYAPNVETSLMINIMKYAIIFKSSADDKRHGCAGACIFLSFVIPKQFGIYILLLEIPSTADSVFFGKSLESQDVGELWNSNPCCKQKAI